MSLSNFRSAAYCDDCFVIVASENEVKRVKREVFDRLGVEDPPEDLVACLVEVRKLKRVAKEMQA